MSEPREHAPPRLAIALVTALVPAAVRDALIGDLLEAFDERAREHGVRRARRWFWRESLAAVITFRGGRRLSSPISARVSWMDAILADARSAVRALRRAPAFTLLCVLTLAIGIGATTAIFSVVNPVLLRPLAYPHPERVMMVWERGADGLPSNLGFPTIQDLARDSRAIERAAAIGSWLPTLTGTGDAERLHGDRVSWTYFQLLGVRPALGRDFAEIEDHPGANRVVILSDALWRRRFGADSSIVGRSISLDGAPYLVAGVMPATFDNIVSPDAQLWRVLGYDLSQPWACRTCRHLRMVARLRPAVSAAVAQQELDRVSADLVKRFPREYPAAGTLVVSLQDDATKGVRPVLLAVLGAVMLLLLIAVANVSNLQLARGMRREGELAIRVALGANRVRLARQLVAEGLTLALLGGAAGVATAYSAVGALVSHLPATVPRMAEIRVDASALALASAVTLVLGVIVGLVPAWHGGRTSVYSSLRDAARVVGAGPRAARAGLVVSEVALALMLLAGTGLLARSMVRLLSVDPGFDPAHVLTVDVQATGSRYADDAAVLANHDRIREAVAALPGVTSVGTTSQLPLAGNIDRYGVLAEDRPLANPELAPYADRYTVSGDLLRALGISIVRGRAFLPIELRDSVPHVVIVSQSLARRIWGNEDAIGKRVRMGGDGPWSSVVGVAGDVRHSGLDEVASMQTYVPERQWRSLDNQVVLVVRTIGNPGELAAAVRRAVRSVDSTQPITRVSTMEQVVATSTAQRRLALTLFTAFAIAAIVLAAAGVYGVLSGTVAERRREIGVRTALGASPRNILAMLLRQGARLALAGIAVGLAGALALGRTLSSMLFGIEPTDPLTLIGVALLLVAVALGASLVPALRAMRIDPMETLRAE